MVKPLVKVAVQHEPQKIEVLRAKSRLRQSHRYSKVFIRSSKPYVERMYQNNMRTMLSLIPNGDSYLVDSRGQLMKQRQITEITDETTDEMCDETTDEMYDEMYDKMSNTIDVTSHPKLEQSLTNRMCLGRQTIRAMELYINTGLPTFQNAKEEYLEEFLPKKRNAYALTLQI